jgi:4-hydroxybenzoate polyprenyltransferase
LILKKIAMVDVFILTTFYSQRILAGGVALEIEISNWLLVFSFFFFLGLSLLKRFADFRTADQKDDSEEVILSRGYSSGDINLLSQLGTSSSMVSVLVFSLYLNSEQVILLYENPDLLWYIAPLLTFWLCRLWLVGFRGQLTSDPVVYAIKDSISYLVLAAIAVLFILAS